MTKGTQKSRHNNFKKNNVTEKHAEDLLINISDRFIASSSTFSVLTDNMGNIMTKHAKNQVITIPDQDASSNYFSVFTNNKYDIFNTKSVKIPKN